MKTPSNPRWARRLIWLCLGLSLGMLAGQMLDPRRGNLAAEDEVETKIRDNSRPEAPELNGATAWINVEKPLTMADLKGKVVLLDFWTFG
jgi:hypothetical protein